jgi:hypothetical protein
MIDHVPVFYHEQTNEVWVEIKCEEAGWLTAALEHSSISARASSASAPPEWGGECSGEVTGPYYAGSDGVHATFDLDYSHGYWDAERQTCDVYAREIEQVTDVTSDSCCGWTCDNRETECELGGKGTWEYPCRCVQTPVILDLDGDGLSLSSAAAGVRFDLDRNGTGELRAWPDANVQDGILALDRNGNGRIDDGGELFGSTTEQGPCERRNGFNALAEFDANKDGLVSPPDPVFDELVVWIDAQRDGQVQAGELQKLKELRITAISLDYKPSRSRDRNGNVTIFRARVERDASRRSWVWAFDVVLRGLP